MRKLFSVVAILTVLIFFQPFLFFHAIANGETETGGDTTQNVPVGPCSSTTPQTFSQLCRGSQGENVPIIIRNAITALMVIAAILALFFLVYGGFKWVTSGGDKGQIDAARKIILAAIVGLILTFLSFFILSVFLGFFGLSLKSLTLPVLPR